jgi:hypothetical protein
MIEALPGIFAVFGHDQIALPGKELAAGIAHQARIVHEQDASIGGASLVASSIQISLVSCLFRSSAASPQLTTPLVCHDCPATEQSERLNSDQTYNAQAFHCRQSTSGIQGDSVG